MNLFTATSPIGVIQPLTSVAEHTLAMGTTNCRWLPHTMARGRRREGEQSIHIAQAPMLIGADEEMAR